MADVENYTLEKAINENVIPPGYKLATSATHRKISDQMLAAEALKEKGLHEEQIWEPRKLKSITALEKLANKGQVASWLGGLIYKPQGSPKLVKAKDNGKDDF